MYDQIVEQPIAAVPAAALQSDVVENADFLGGENGGLAEDGAAVRDSRLDFHVTRWAASHLQMHPEEFSSGRVEPHRGIGNDRFVIVHTLDAN